MAKNEKNKGVESAPEVVPEAPVEVDVVVDTPADAAPEPEAAPAHAAMVVAGAPATAMTQAQINADGDLKSRIKQMEAGLQQLELQVIGLADKYPDWSEGLMDAMGRYGMANNDEAFDVSVNAPLTYINLRHGMSKNAPRGMGIEIGMFYTDSKNLGEKFDAVLIYAHDARKRFLPGAELGAPDCQSYDGKFGNKWGECAVCPYSQFDEATQKSDCSRGYAVMLATPDFSVIGELSFMKARASSGKHFLQKMRTMQGGHSNWTTEISTVEKKSGQYTNLVPTGGLPKTATTPEQREVLGVLTKFFKLRSTLLSTRAELRREQKGLGAGGGGALGAGSGAGALGAGGTETEPPLL